MMMSNQSSSHIESMNSNRAEGSLIKIIDHVEDLSDDDSDDSFEILSTHSLEKFPSQSNSEVLAPLTLNNVTDLKSYIKDEISCIETHSVNELSPKVSLQPQSSLRSFQDVQKQIQDLIAENEKLKNTILDNNSVMTNQYEKIAEWKLQVHGVCNEYKQQLSNARCLVDACKENTLKLQCEIEVYKNLKALQDEEIIRLKGDLDRKDGNNVVFKNHSDVSDLGIKLSELENALAESNIEKSDLHFNKLNLEQQVKALEAQLEKLLKNNEETVQCNFDSMIALKKELEDISGKLAYSTKNITMLEKELEEKKSLIHDLELEIKDSKSKKEGRLSVEETLSLQKELSVLQPLLQSKDLIIDELTLKLNEEVRNQEDLQTVRRQLAETQMQVLSLNDLVNEKVREIEELRDLLTQANLKDEMYALQSQLEVYMKDFKAEKAAKDQYKKERDQLAEDLQNVQTRNKQMQVEIERLRALNVPRRSESYLCPKCGFGFNTYQSLENHVHRCLEVD